MIPHDEPRHWGTVRDGDHLWRIEVSLKGIQVQDLNSPTGYKEWISPVRLQEFDKSLRTRG